MTNEELATAIKEGREDLLLELWGQVRKFIRKQAYKRYQETGGFGGVEAEDLTQSGYFALVEAVRYFEPEAGYSFLAVLGNCLKTAFARAGGYRTTKKDALDNSKSLDEPLTDDPEGLTLAGTLADPVDAFEEVNQKIWQEELRAAIEAAIHSLPEEEAETLRGRYYHDKTFAEIGKEIGTTAQRVRTLEYSGLKKLRQPSSGLARFIEDTTNYYAHVGVAAFQRTRTSAVEMIAIHQDERIKHG